MLRTRWRLGWVIFILLSAVACTAQPQPGNGTLQTPGESRPTAQDGPSQPIAGLMPSPSATATATPTPTGTPTPTTTPLHALTIAYLRQQEFPPGEILFEQTLDNGANYYRHIVSYRSDGLKIYALLTIPFGEPPQIGWPVVIFNHGYIPPEIYRTTERYIAYVDAFATNGYVVLRSDYRGHDQSEGEARGAYGYPDYTIDVLNAVAAIRELAGIDPERIGMWGHSMGGYITLRAMVADQNILAGVIWAGVVGPYPNLFNRENFSLTPTPDGRGAWRIPLIETYGSPDQNPEFWSSLSANNFLADLSGPLQLHHGTADASVPHTVSELLFGQVEAIGGQIELFLYPGDDHNLAIGFSLAMQRSIQFFDRLVKNAVPLR